MHPTPQCLPSLLNQSLGTLTCPGDLLVTIPAANNVLQAPGPHPESRVGTAMTWFQTRRPGLREAW